MAKRKPKPRDITLIEKLKPESFGEYASMMFARTKQ